MKKVPTNKALGLIESLLDAFESNDKQRIDSCFIAIKKYNKRWPKQKKILYEFLKIKSNRKV